MDAWPIVDISALKEDRRDRFLQRCAAIQLYLHHPQTTVAEISRSTGVTRTVLLQTLQRCLSPHPDGRIYGFRGAIPSARIKLYARHKAVSASREGKSGASGAFKQLMLQHPDIDAYLRRLFGERNRPVSGPAEVRKSMRALHQLFLKRCRDAGIAATSYPFSEARLGIRSLYTYFTALSMESYDMSVTHAKGQTRRAAPSNEPAGPAATRAYEVVEFDGHKIDLRLSVRISGPSGLTQLIELHRIWILVLLDVATRCVIGYHIALSREYNKDDVASALQAALTPFKPRDYSIPTLAIRPGGGYPSAAVPETAYACWDWFRCDNAKAHMAADTLERLTQTIGCWTHIGPPAQPNDRPHIERFFDLVAKHFAHTLPGNLGSDPGAIERALSDPGTDTRLLVELTELEEMIEVLIGDYNGEPHQGLSGKTPLEAMAYSMAKHGHAVRVLPKIARANLCLLHEAKVVTVQGKLTSGARPHVNFCNVRYTSPLLSSMPALIGKKLRIYFDVRDIRVLRAFFDDGTELGVLTAARPWCFTPHSLRVRQEIFKLIAEGKLRLREGDSPTEAWVRYRLSQPGVKRHSGKLAKQQRAERAAVELAKAVPEQIVRTHAADKTGEKVAVAIPSAPIPELPGDTAGHAVPDGVDKGKVVPLPLRVRKTFTL